MGLWLQGRSNISYNEIVGMKWSLKRGRETGLGSQIGN